MSSAQHVPRRVRIERNIYRRSIGVLEVGFKDAAGIQRWRTVDGGIMAARRLRDDFLAHRSRGETVAPHSAAAVRGSRRPLVYRSGARSSAVDAGEVSEHHGPASAATVRRPHAGEHHGRRPGRARTSDARARKKRIHDCRCAGRCRADLQVRGSAARLGRGKSDSAAALLRAPEGLTGSGGRSSRPSRSSRRSRPPPSRTARCSPWRR